MFDLTLLPLNIIDGQEKPDLSGIGAYNPTRRPARGRSGDQLLVMFVPPEGQLILGRELQRLVDLLAETFYQTPGSVTAALKSAVDSLSQSLLGLKAGNNENGRKGPGALTLAVLRGSTLYLAHSGLTNSLLLSIRGVEHFHDPQAGGTGLGLSHPVPLRFFQVETQPGDRLLFCPFIPETWSTNALETGLALASADLRKRLVDGIQGNLQAVLVQFQPGSGKINLEQLPTGTQPLLDGEELLTDQLFKPQKGIISKTEEPQEPAQTESDPLVTTPIFEGTQSNSYHQVPLQNTDPGVGKRELPPARRQSSRLAQKRALPAEKDNKASATTSASSDNILPDEYSPRWKTDNLPDPAPRRKFRASTFTIPVLTALLKTIRGTRTVGQRIGVASGNFWPRLLPGQSDQPSSLSPLTMAFVAITVPLIIVAVGLSVYFKRGSDQQYQENFSQAVEAATLTENQTDPEILRSAWSLAIYWLDKAEMNQVTGETMALRQQAQQAIDGLDSTLRLDFQPALTGDLPLNVNISKIVPTSSDLFVLDSAKGSVIRLTVNGRGYAADPDFQCGPGQSGSYMISNLVDITPLPKGNEFGAVILALDSSGNALFCGPGIPPTSIPLEPPDNLWGKITAVTYQAQMLYVLDPMNNAVWVYAGTESFREKPYMFFGSNIPPIQDVIDLTINADDMYLLHTDGHLTMCTVIFGAEYTTRCTDPAVYNDPRPGHTINAATLPDIKFTQIQYTQPPDPSIYLFEPNQGAIYHFSVRLNLQRVLKSLTSQNNPLQGQPATAFAIGSNRMVYIAFGNNIFHALIN